MTVSSIIILVVILTLALLLLPIYFIRQFKAIQRAKERIELNIDNAYAEMLEILSQDEYLQESTKVEYHKRYSELFGLIDTYGPKIYPQLPASVAVKCREFENTYKDIDKKKVLHNEMFVENQKTVNSEYFDTLLNYPLSEQQRDAIVTAEDNCLVVSAAGSGKTSTMEGKVRYLVEKRCVAPSQILMVTYTRKAAHSLTQRLNIDGLVCSTFNSFALKIIGEATGKKPTICNEEEVREFVYNTLLQQEAFLKAVNKYLLDYLRPEWFECDCGNDVAKYVKENKKGDMRSALPDMDGNYAYPKSSEERTICEILAKNGLEFRYEEKYEFDVANQNHKQYQPDFSIYYTDKEGTRQRVYLEHFGIDQNGNVSKRWGDGTEAGWQKQNQQYQEGIIWKRGIHKIYGTILLETTSADFKRGNNIEGIILGKLNAIGVPIHPLSDVELYQKLIQGNKKKAGAVVTLISTFVTLMKGRCTTIAEVISGMDKDDVNYHRDLDIITSIVAPYYDLYENTLQEKGMVDFTDSIIMATKCCQDGYHPRYDYILIDEFQDISIDKYKFIQALRTVGPMTKLFCVGDDWQSIYRFSGSAMALFKDFPDYFGYTVECKLESTYRFFEPLIGLSSSFIEKNPQQTHKSVRNTMSGRTDIEFVSYKDDIDFRQQLARVIDAIPIEKSIYLLGRYGFETNTLRSAQFAISGNDDWQKVIYKGRTMDYMTVHKAKGLESDYVILLNCNSGTYGFPSTIADDHVLSHVLSEEDAYEYGEERRVFYVAITRSKIKTIVLYRETTPSSFISEFLPSVEGTSEACPLCKTGHRTIFKKGIARNGAAYFCYKCTNQPFGCEYYSTVFVHEVSEFS